MKKLYSFSWSYPRAGCIEGLFIADDKAVAELIGKELYFGEVLGKHSELYGPLQKEDLTIDSEDQELIKSLKEAFGSSTLCGYNPLDYIRDEEE